MYSQSLAGSSGLVQDVRVFVRLLDYFHNWRRFLVEEKAVKAVAGHDEQRANWFRERSGLEIALLNSRYLVDQVAQLIDQSNVKRYLGREFCAWQRAAGISARDRKLRDMDIETKMNSSVQKHQLIHVRRVATLAFSERIHSLLAVRLLEVCLANWCYSIQKEVTSQIERLLRVKNQDELNILRRHILNLVDSRIQIVKRLGTVREVVEMKAAIDAWWLETAKGILIKEKEADRRATRRELEARDAARFERVANVVLMSFKVIKAADGRGTRNYVYLCWWQYVSNKLLRKKSDETETTMKAQLKNYHRKDLAYGTRFALKMAEQKKVLVRRNCIACWCFGAFAQRMESALEKVTRQTQGLVDRAYRVTSYMRDKLDHSHAETLLQAIVSYWRGAAQLTLGLRALKESEAKARNESDLDFLTFVKEATTSKKLAEVSFVLARMSMAKSCLGELFYRWRSGIAADHLEAATAAVKELEEGIVVLSDHKDERFRKMQEARSSFVTRLHRKMEMTRFFVAWMNVKPLKTSTKMFQFLGQSKEKLQGLAGYAAQDKTQQMATTALRRADKISTLHATIGRMQLMYIILMALARNRLDEQSGRSDAAHNQRYEDHIKRYRLAREEHYKKTHSMATLHEEHMVCLSYTHAWKNYVDVCVFKRLKNRDLEFAKHEFASQNHESLKGAKEAAIRALKFCLSDYVSVIMLGTFVAWRHMNAKGRLMQRGEDLRLRHDDLKAVMAHKHDSLLNSFLKSLGEKYTQKFLANVMMLWVKGCRFSKSEHQKIVKAQKHEAARYRIALLRPFLMDPTKPSCGMFSNEYLELLMHCLLSRWRLVIDTGRSERRYKRACAVFEDNAAALKTLCRDNVRRGIQFSTFSNRDRIEEVVLLATFAIWGTWCRERRAGKIRTMHFEEKLEEARVEGFRLTSAAKKGVSICVDQLVRTAQLYGFHLWRLAIQIDFYLLRIANLESKVQVLNADLGRTRVDYLEQMAQKVNGYLHETTVRIGKRFDDLLLDFTFFAWSRLILFIRDKRAVEDLCGVTCANLEKLMQDALLRHKHASLEVGGLHKVINNLAEFANAMQGMMGLVKYYTIWKTNTFMMLEKKRRANKVAEIETEYFVLTKEKLKELVKYLRGQNVKRVGPLVTMDFWWSRNLLLAWRLCAVTSISSSLVESFKADLKKANDSVVAMKHLVYNAKFKIGHAWGSRRTLARQLRLFLGWHYEITRQKSDLQLAEARRDMELKLLAAREARLRAEEETTLARKIKMSSVPSGTKLTQTTESMFGQGFDQNLSFGTSLVPALLQNRQFPGAERMFHALRSAARKTLSGALLRLLTYQPPPWRVASHSPQRLGLSRQASPRNNARLMLGNGMDSQVGGGDDLALARAPSRLHSSEDTPYSPRWPEVDDRSPSQRAANRANPMRGRLAVESGIVPQVFLPDSPGIDDLGFLAREDPDALGRRALERLAVLRQRMSDAIPPDDSFPFGFDGPLPVGSNAGGRAGADLATSLARLQETVASMDVVDSPQTQASGVASTNAASTAK